MAALKGNLTAYFETGMEGIAWSFEEEGKEGYDGLHPLKNGDILRVFNDASKKTVLWEGAVDLEKETNRQSRPTNPEYKQQVVFGMWVHGLQKGMDPETWAQMFIDEKPAELIQKPKGP